jgi:hypothetical protein
MSDTQKRYYQKNREKRLAANKAWREAQGESLRIRDRARKRAEYAADPGRIKARTRANAAKAGTHRRQRLKRKYGITPEDFECMWNEQKGCCKLCGRKLSAPGHRNDSATVDHCHETGKVRGILCSPCNLILGKVEAGWDLDAFSRNVRRYLVDPQG